MKITAWFVDSWIRVQQPDDHIEYRIVMRGENGEEWDSFHRYSSLRQFHKKTIISCIDSVQSIPLTFPDKMLLSRQTDSFATSRARALDAYLQRLLIRINPQPQSFLDFFNVPAVGTPAATTQLKSPIVSLRTPRYEIKNSFNWSTELKRLDELLTRLNGKVSIDSSIELDCDLDEAMKHVMFRANRALKDESEAFEFKKKYFDIKREYEIYKIKKSDSNFLNALKNSFLFPDEQHHIVHDGNSDLEQDTTSPSIISSTINRNTCSQIQSPAQNVDPSSSLKCHLNHQEAILSDLTVTFQEQKMVSKALAAEIEEQNKFLNAMQTRQDEIKTKFDKSNEKVRKIE